MNFKVINKNELFINLSVLCITLFFCTIVVEIVLRTDFVSNRLNLAIHRDERNLTYKHDSLLGWFPIENSKKEFKAHRSIHVAHNSRGFRDDEHILDTRNRIVFLGDSFVWGYDLEKSERFSDKLQAMLPDWAIYNLGVSGYGTDQEYLLLKKHYDFYKPDIVFLVFCSVNDVGDNSSNQRYRGYYKPYFVTHGSDLELMGVPVPKTEKYSLVHHDTLAKSYTFRLLVKTYYKYKNPPKIKIENPTFAILKQTNEFVKSKGSQFFVGLQEPNSELETFLEDFKISYIDLSNPYKYPDNIGHWNPEGNTAVSKKIYDFLINGNFLEM